MNRCMISRRALEDLVDAVVAHHALDADRPARPARPASARSRSRARRGSASCRRRSPSSARCSIPWPPPPPAGCRSRRGPPSPRPGSPPPPWRRCARPCWRASARWPRGGRWACPTARAPSDHRRQISRQIFAVPTDPLGMESRPSFSVASAILSPRPSCPIRFSRGHADVGEADDAVGQGAQAHEVRAVLDLHPRPGRLHHERADFLRARVHRHHHQQLGQGAVGAPQLGAVQHVGGAVRGLLGGGGDARGIGSDLGLGEGKGGDLPRRAPRQVLLLLLLGAEVLQRVGHADRLVRGQQRDDVAVAAAQQLHHLLVLDVGEAEPAVLLARSSSRRRPCGAARRARPPGTRPRRRSRPSPPRRAGTRASARRSARTPGGPRRPAGRGG